MDPHVTKRHMRATPQGIGCALAAFVALAAAATSLGIMADQMINYYTGAAFTWWQITVLACAAVAAAAGVLVILFEVSRGARCCACFAGPRSTAGVLLCLLGFVAHSGMLVSFTVYLAKYFSRDLSDAWASSDSSYNASFSCLSGKNAFACFGDWPILWQVMYIFGCAIGVLFWLIAFFLALLALGASKRRQVIDQPAKMGRPPVGHEFIVSHDELVRGQQAPPPASAGRRAGLPAFMGGRKAPPPAVVMV